MPITLSKENTIALIYQSNKLKYHQNKRIFKTMYPWKCLKCSTDILISFKQFSNIAIFCDACKSEANNKDKDIKLIQYQYMKVVKFNQLKMIESFLDKIKI